MYVCICNAITEAEIKQAAADGANCLKHLEAKLGVSNQCGACACEAKQCLNKALEDQIGSLDLITY
ncbi:MAG: (2Fe-2S)-binding protein [Proteobacteria bacterium]|nr:(2Fe-2S)-binding protein [Pseudomonadota bacterium]